MFYLFKLLEDNIKYLVLVFKLKNIAQIGYMVEMYHVYALCWFLLVTCSVSNQFIYYIIIQ